MARSSALVAVLILLIPLVQAASFVPLLNFTSSSPLIFHSLATLLQAQPQTYFPNGHTIASVTIPHHTLLYHGRHDNDAVPSPEWLSLDIEMAYAIMGNMPDSRMLTYRTTKSVKAVYFDGTSASLMGEGTLSQMVLLYNGTDDVPKRGGRGPPAGRGRGDENRFDDEDEPPRRPPGRGPPHHWNPLQEEYFRARELCKWLQSRGLGGKGWGYEGVVRMNAGFELIWCDFDSPSLKLISNLDVSAPRNSYPGWQQLLELQAPASAESQARMDITEDEGPHGPGMTDPREPFRNSSNWFWFASAAKSYLGDNRIKVDSCGIFSFYEPALKTQTHSRIQDDLDRLNWLEPDGTWKHRRPANLHDYSWVEQGRFQSLLRRRRQHRLTSVGKQDGSYMLAAVEERLQNALKKEGCRGSDWHYIAKDIVSRYSKELETLLHWIREVPQPFHKHRTMSHETLAEWLHQLRQLTHWFLLPFYEYPQGRPYPKDKLKGIFSLDAPQTLVALERCISQYTDSLQPVSDEDIVLGKATRDILQGLCSTVIRIGLSVEYTYFRHFDGVTQEHLDPLREIYALDDAYIHMTTTAGKWDQQMEELLAWLGWAERWTRCEKQCDVGEVCYLPMWPVAGWERRRGPRAGWEDSRFLWNPVCVNQTTYPPEEWKEVEALEESEVTDLMVR